MSLTPSIRMLVLPVSDPDSFETLSLADRLEQSIWNEEFSATSGEKPGEFFLRAVDADLGVFSYGEQDLENELVETCFIDGDTLADRYADLRRLVDEDADSTVRALAKADPKADVDAIRASLGSGDRPELASPAVEAAAFARTLLTAAEQAVGNGLGVCWELHGSFE